MANTKLNQTKIAERFGVSGRRIRTLSTEGWLERDDDGMYDLAQASEVFGLMDPSQRAHGRKAVEGRTKKKVQPNATKQPSPTFKWLPVVDPKMDPPATIGRGFGHGLDRYASAMEHLRDL